MKIIQKLKTTRRALFGRSLLLIAGLTIGMTAVTSAHADAFEDILAQKKIVVGVINDFPPFGFLDAQQNPQGYDIDVARAIADDLGVELELVTVSTPNRIPYLTSKRIDTLVASLGITPERAEQVLFTNPYAATQVTILAPSAVTIASVDDLVGKRVAVARGSSTDIFFTQVAPEGATVMRFESEVTASQAMLAGQVDAIVLTNTMVPSVVQSEPDLKLEIKLALRQQENAIAVRRGETALSERINAVLDGMKSSGALAENYRKWTGADLPEFKGSAAAK